MVKEESQSEFSRKTYEGFPYPVTEIVKFIENADEVSLMLLNGSIIHYTPHDAGHFKRWLEYHNVQDIIGTG